MTDTSTATPEEDKNKGGRPLKFESVKILKQKIEEYFGDCDSHEAEHSVVRKKSDGSQYIATEIYLTVRQPYTVNGLARALRTTRDTLLDYERGNYDEKEEPDENGDRFSDAIKDAKARINEDVERRTMAGETPAAAGIFWLKNNDGWKDRQEIDHTSKDQPIPLLAGLAPATLVVEDEDDDAAVGGDDSPSED